MAASLRSPPSVPAAFRRSRASSSPSPPPSSPAPKARFVARCSESVSVQQLARPIAEYVSLPASQYTVHKGGLVCPVPWRPWRGEGSRGRRRYAGRRATGRAEEPLSPPAAAAPAQPTGASAGKAVVPDDEFSLAKVSFGVIGLGVGISLLS
ncbi:hypothetical protein C2845_PM15G24890 [Panicum miliaceum]|uniref:Uncharacterized protein n=1 Tax=Panicum miliaceum TaxID=4540 RepID=A0A3L6Q7Y7_PANMI|nr:hypothetical protein C2845_PM15G24890 [Panicum miliaceum]